MGRQPSKGHRLGFRQTIDFIFTVELIYDYFGFCETNDENITQTYIYKKIRF